MPFKPPKARAETGWPWDNSEPEGEGVIAGVRAGALPRAARPGIMTRVQYAALPRNPGTLASRAGIRALVRPHPGYRGDGRAGRAAPEPATAWNPRQPIRLTINAENEPD